MPPGQRKLRDSCDSCHIAKVKCIKTKTGECMRCTSSGSVCSFSPSDRRGKPRGAKNKCNRVPPAQPVVKPATSQTVKIPTQLQAPDSMPLDEAYPSPVYEFDKYFNTTQADFATADVAAAAAAAAASVAANASAATAAAATTATTWTLPTPEDGSQCFDLCPSDGTLTSLAQADWMSLDGHMMHSASPLQQHTPRTSVSSTYMDPPLVSPHQFHSPPFAALHEGGMFDSLGATPSAPPSCDCHPISPQQIYTLHYPQITAASGNTTTFDVALFINNKAVERCHSMLSCSECVLNSDKDKGTANMLTLAGAMDEILMSYGDTCTALLDGTAQDSLVFSSGDSVSASSSSGTPPHLDDTDFTNRAHSTASSASSSASSTKGRALFTPTTQLSLGTYRIDGEDGYHLKLEILKIELRKVERLWVAFRDVCAMQKFEDEQKSLYAALVCYLAKKLRRTAEGLEARRRVSTAGW